MIDIEDSSTDEDDAAPPPAHAPEVPLQVAHTPVEHAPPQQQESIATPLTALEAEAEVEDVMGQRDLQLAIEASLKQQQGETSNQHGRRRSTNDGPLSPALVCKRGRARA